MTLSERCYVLIFVLARFGRGLFIVLAFSVTLSERCYVLIFVLARFGRGAVITHNHQPQQAATGALPRGLCLAALTGVEPSKRLRQELVL